LDESHETFSRVRGDRECEIIDGKFIINN
jgi:hypothetical protein